MTANRIRDPRTGQLLPNLDEGRSRRLKAERAAWRGMIRRCYRKDHKEWSRFGGRGIGVWEEWRESFENFIDDVGEKPEPKRQFILARKDKLGDYAPGNVEWVTHEQHENNKGTNLILQVGGERLTLAQATKKFRVPKQTVSRRLLEGKTVEKAMEQRCTLTREGDVSKVKSRVGHGGSD